MAKLKVVELSLLERLCREIRAETQEPILRKKLGNLFEAYNLFNFKLSYDPVFWRARLCETDMPFRHVSEMGCPPAHLVGAGRFNAEGKPVLYVSPNQFSVIREVGASQEDYVQVMAYEFRPERSLRCAVLGEIERVQRWGTMFVDGRFHHEINRILNKLDFEAASSFTYLDSFLASLMRDPSASENRYLHSRTLADLIFEKKYGIQAILYSGIAVEGAMNVAIPTAVADEILEPKASILLRITQMFDFGLCRFVPIAHTKGISSDGFFEWKMR